MDSQKFGTLISELRKERGWTQLELAQKLNVTDGHNFRAVFKTVYAGFDKFINNFTIGQTRIHTPNLACPSLDVFVQSDQILQVPAAAWSLCCLRNTMPS